MITMFTIPKAFQGNTDIIQINAIRSWLQLRPQPEIVLFGNDKGTAETASGLGISHISDIGCNEYGTPLLNSVFSLAQSKSENPLMCFINADIILLNDFLTSVMKVREKRFLLVGQRWDIDLNDPVNYNCAEWESALRLNIAQRAKLHAKSGIDYFVFPRGLFSDIPPFAIGRTAWDNWLIYRARSLNVPVIDGTKTITAVHQNHDYSHVPGGSSAVWKGPESQRNVELTGGKYNGLSMEYATHLLTPQGTKAALTARTIYFRIREYLILHPQIRFLLVLFKTFEWLAGRVRSSLHPL